MLYCLQKIEFIQSSYSLIPITSNTIYQIVTADDNVAYISVSIVIVKFKLPVRL